MRTTNATTGKHKWSAIADPTELGERQEGAVRRLLTNRNAITRAMLGVSENGVPGLLFHDNQGKRRALMAVSEKGEPGLLFTDKNEKVIWSGP